MGYFGTPRFPALNLEVAIKRKTNLFFPKRSDLESETMEDLQVQRPQLNEYTGMFLLLLGGLSIGYVIGVSSCVLLNLHFLKIFFSSVDDHQNPCMFNNQLLALFTSSLYLSAPLGHFSAPWIANKYGHKQCIKLGAACFVLGGLVNGFAINIYMLTIGRLVLGLGLGCLNQVLPTYHRNIVQVPYLPLPSFTAVIKVGIYVSTLANLLNNRLPLPVVSLGYPAFFGVVLLWISAYLPPDTTNNNEDKETRNCCLTTLLSTKCRPQLVLATCMPLFQQLTGYNVIIFFAPILFKALGISTIVSFGFAIVIGVVDATATWVAPSVLGGLGRKFPLIFGGTIMFVCQVWMSLIWFKFSDGIEGSTWYMGGLLVLICTYVTAFAWSWGHLPQKVIDDILPENIYSIGNNVNVGVNMLMNLVISQFSMKMLCLMGFKFFYLLSGFSFVMTIFVILLLPETEDIPIGEILHQWARHWLWKKTQ